MRYARQVRDGRYDLGVIDAPAWDELGVSSLEPLQAPLLITGQSLFRRRSSRARWRQDARGTARAARGRAVVGDDLLATPGRRRGAVNVTRRTSSGKRILAPVSRVNDAAISALGATPAAPQLRTQQDQGRTTRSTGRRCGAFARPGVWLTPNVTFFADASHGRRQQRRFAKLSDEQQRVLRTAAAHAARERPASMVSRPRGRHGRAPLPPWSRRARQPHGARRVRAGDAPCVRHSSSATRRSGPRSPRIRELKAPHAARPSAQDPRELLATRRASRPSASASATRAFVDGTYRWRVTRAGALKLGADPHDDGHRHDRDHDAARRPDGSARRAPARRGAARSRSSATASP